MISPASPNEKGQLSCEGKNRGMSYRADECLELTKKRKGEELRESCNGSAMHNCVCKSGERIMMYLVMALQTSDSRCPWNLDKKASSLL